VHGSPSCSMLALNVKSLQAGGACRRNKNSKKKKTNLITGGLLNLKLVFASIFYDFTVFPLGC